MSNLEERSNCFSLVAALATLAEGIVTHSPHFAFMVYTDKVIKTTRDLLNFGEVFHINGLLKDELTREPGFATRKHPILQTHGLLDDLEHEEFAIFRKHKHSRAGERNLTRLASFGQRSH